MDKAGEEISLMRKTFDLAMRGRGRTFPNPMVGAVIVREGKVVGEGYHHRAGEPHAEDIALRAAGDAAGGGTLYVNLEPCNHQGNTPPCTEAIIAAGIERVVCSMKDPNPRVDGSGLKRLVEAGIDVTVGLLEEEAVRLNEVYIKNISTSLPFVALKIAQSIDGRIATGLGSSKWITGIESRKFVHRLRDEYAAVMVGIGTVLTDDPRLTVREVDCSRPPLRVVLDSNLKIPSTARVLDASGGFGTLIYTSVSNLADGRYPYLEKEGVSIRILKGRGGRLDLLEVLGDLFRKGVSSVLVEGGTKLFTSFLSRGLVDKLFIFIGPVIIGGGSSYPSFDELGIKTIDEAVRVMNFDSIRLGGDMLMIGYPDNACMDEA